MIPRSIPLGTLGNSKPPLAMLNMDMGAEGAIWVILVPLEILEIQRSPEGSLRWEEWVAER